MSFYRHQNANGIRWTSLSFRSKCSGIHRSCRWSCWSIQVRNTDFCNAFFDFRGVVPTFLSNAPFSALHFMFYRKMQALMYGDMENFTMTKNFVCSTTAAAVATLITQPFDVVRSFSSYIDSQTIWIQGSYTSPAWNGSFWCFAICRNAKTHFLPSRSQRNDARYVIPMLSLFIVLKGVAPRIVKRTLQTGMIWTLYEEIAPRIRNAFPQKMH